MDLVPEPPTDVVTDRGVLMAGPGRRLEGLRTEPGKQRVPGRLAAPEVVDQAEAARVIEADHGSVVERQHDMIVLGAG